MNDLDIVSITQHPYGALVRTRGSASVQVAFSSAPAGWGHVRLDKPAGIVTHDDIIPHLSMAVSAAKSANRPQTPVHPVRRNLRAIDFTH